MFTGIVTEIGKVLSVTGTQDRTVRIASETIRQDQSIGASVSCNGICLTIVRLNTGGAGWFEVQVSGATSAVTNVSDWQPGHAVNLERSLRVGDELGGHIVTGHVDGLAITTNRREAGDSVEFRLESPVELARYIAPKGSVALNGVSLTINEVEDTSFSVNIIPHTLSSTSWGAIIPGDRLNMEVDTVARYVARILKS